MGFCINLRPGVLKYHRPGPGGRREGGGGVQPPGEAAVSQGECRKCPPAGTWVMRKYLSNLIEKKVGGNLAHTGDG